ncbi:hypothetical protein PHLGIDRAFT_17778 [Phlebiopsis gigantea 11061_1 CR5-6]|uniref:Uncharacterized protein n=1 Tax=Phlebiopsis gigantea (strain 11061_1 CR5-6) TaxID=745531 RepID=A0A0C3SFE8_PHLG1|nr:hypothetical protein PHLGIDRAFT_17778 [Phlebiopsis gigantea 11061_1 CR5-6]
MVHNADFASAPNASTPVFSPRVSPGTPSGKRDVLDSIEQLGAAGNALPAGSPIRRDINTVLGDINILNNYYTQMSQHAGNFRRLSQTPKSARGQNFEQQSADEATAFHTNLLGFQNTLAQLGADKGLANYDKDDDLETVLKDLVNSVKYLLSDIDDMVYDIPDVGPILGPIVYQIKCLLDEVLDAVENLTDAIINAVKPLLQGVIGDASRTACNSGIQIAGLCLVL